MNITATARDAGRNVVHTVTADVEVVAPTRRSAHRYAYAIVAIRKRGTEPVVFVRRWSRSSKHASDEQAITVVEVQA